MHEARHRPSGRVTRVAFLREQIVVVMGVVSGLCEVSVGSRGRAREITPWGTR